MTGSKAVPIESWIRFTIFNGFAAVISYLATVFIPLPVTISLLLAFLFGPFFMMATLGTFFIIKSWKASTFLFAGTVFNLVATAFVTLMLVVQQSSYAFHDQFKTQVRPGVSNEQLNWIFKEVNSVQLGMDVTWDIFVSAGTFFLALSIYKHPVFKNIFAYTGMLAAVLLFSFNMYYFPQPPASTGSIDFGPLVSLWYSALTVYTLIKRKTLSKLANFE